MQVINWSKDPMDWQTTNTRQYSILKLFIWLPNASNRGFTRLLQIILPNIGQVLYINIAVLLVIYEVSFTMQS